MKSDAPRTFRAPGRVNLIGEHTDYNDGFVLPVALDLDCRVTAAPCEGETLRAAALDLGPSQAEWTLAALASAERRGDWSDYVAGVAVQLLRKGVTVPALDLEITSAVPMGAGLSSSAALEVASALALSAWDGEPLASRDLAVLCQRAEVEFVGLQCGIMDQFVSVFGRRGHALLVDCRSLDCKLVAIPAQVEIVVIDSGVKHQLAGSEYNVRRAECAQAAAELGRPLRDISVEQLSELSPRVEGKLLRRARHIVHENQRVLDFVAAAERGELSRLGELMAASHWSLAVDYEVSCPELDFLVETAARAQGVIGARMTGGGFGGCTVNLVERSAVEGFREAVAEAYKARFGWRPEVYVCNSGDGAGEVGIN